MVADHVIFNSEYNKESFLNSVGRHLKLIPDHRPKNLGDKIRPKCRVIYFPLTFVDNNTEESGPKERDLQCRPPIFAFSKEQGKIAILSSDQCTNNRIHPSPNEKIETKPSHVVVDVPTVSKSSFLEITETATVDSHKSPDLSDESSFFGASEAKLPKLKNNESEYLLHELEVEKSSAMPNSDCNGDFDAVDTSGACLDDSMNEIQEVSTEIPSCDKLFPARSNSPLHIVWPHRWEHDKGPQAFFDALFQLQADGFDFIVSVIGETFSQIPDIFPTAFSKLGDRVRAWGYQSKKDYVKILKSAHVVVSTADHEFFGVSMLEATNHGCYPLCPRRLVYPEIYPDECLYSTQAQLVKRLKQFCRRPDKITPPVDKIIIDTFSWAVLKAEYRKLLLETS